MQTLKNGQSFNDFVKLHGKEQLVLSLRSVHDWAIYDLGKKLSRKKREQLHDLRLLAEKLNELEV